MFKRCWEQMWSWMTDERQHVSILSSVAVGLVLFGVMVFAFSRLIAPLQITGIEVTRAHAAKVCQSPEALRAYQQRAGNVNGTIMDWQEKRQYPVFGRIFISPAWEGVKFIEIPGTTCPELS